MPRVFQPVDKTVEATIQGQYFDQLIENKFYAKAADVVTDLMVAEIAGIVDSWVGTNVLPNMPPSYSYLRTIARDLTSAASFETIDNAHAGPGTNASAGLTSNVTLAVHRKTPFSGVKQKSRIYWPVMLPGQLSDVDHVSSVSGAAIVGLLDALRTAILAGTETTWEYGYVQRIIGGVKLAAGNFIPVIAHSLTDLVLDSMRDRLPGHGV